MASCQKLLKSFHPYRIGRRYCISLFTDVMNINILLLSEDDKYSKFTWAKATQFCFYDIYCILHKFKVVYVTNPESWTAAAMYQATRIFVSNMNAKMAQR